MVGRISQLEGHSGAARTDDDGGISSSEKPGSHGRSDAHPMACIVHKNSEQRPTARRMRMVAA